MYASLEIRASAMKNQGPYQATLFIAIAQSNLIGVAFGYWVAPAAKEASPFSSAMIYTIWLAVSWWVWRWARKRFWPEEVE